MKCEHISRTSFCTFDSGLFDPIENKPSGFSDYPKPKGGLWAVPVHADSDGINHWKEFIEQGPFPNQVLSGFSFVVSSSARVVTIETPDDIATLPSFDHFSGFDWERLAVEQDVLHVGPDVLDLPQFSHWDVESVLVLQPHVIIDPVPIEGL